MASTRWSRRRTRRTLRRGLTRFEVRLKSACPGIGFTAWITATVTSEPPYADTEEEIVHAIRIALRQAAADASQTCDPADLPSARDVCGQHLRRPRTLPTDPPVNFRADLTLDLLPDDRAAVGALLAAQRQQAVNDILRRQKTEALASELAEPAAVLVRWIEQEQAAWTKPPNDDAVKTVASAFAAYRPERERTIDHEALEVLREFLSSFPDPAQKRMLYTLMAAGMAGAQRPQHAAKAQGLLNGHTPTDSAGAP
ncbi:hypothetical protein [Streptomyces tubercidicus]|uniref:hypothetical protein n=1 Tax=Streptomyces tubercidicus TaxID=47759 RepID=UPI002E0E9E59|nr:hypothetical protein OG761_21580 [Streptomyces tubercidicus]